MTEHNIITVGGSFASLCVHRRLQRSLQRSLSSFKSPVVALEGQKLPGGCLQSAPATCRAFLCLLLPNTLLPVNVSLGRSRQLFSSPFLDCVTISTYLFLQLGRISSPEEQMYQAEGPDTPGQKAAAASPNHQVNNLR